MTEFTKEQEAEIQKRIDAARIDQANFEQFKITSDQFFREALTSVASKVQMGVYDNEILEVGKLHYAAFKQQYMPKQKPRTEPDAAGDANGPEAD